MGVAALPEHGEQETRAVTRRARPAKTLLWFVLLYSKTVRTHPAVCAGARQPSRSVHGTSHCNIMRIFDPEDVIWESRAGGVSPRPAVPDGTMCAATHHSMCAGSRRVPPSTRAGIPALSLIRRAGTKGG